LRNSTKPGDPRRLDTQRNPSKQPIPSAPAYPERHLPYDIFPKGAVATSNPIMTQCRRTGAGTSAPADPT